MTDKEIKELEERTYAIGWSGFPIDALFNDIRDNNNPRFNKDLAYQDFKKVIDEIYRLKEIEKQQSTSTFEQYIKEWEDRGFEDIKNNNKSFSVRNEKLNVDIYIDKRSKIIQITTCHYNYAQDISFELHHLIHKTLKALEECNGQMS